MTQRTAATNRVAALLGDARVRVLTELCGRASTAAEVAARVGTSTNAVRVHLDGLREAGLVDFIIERRGVGKPRHVYAMTPAAEELLSAAYAPALLAVLETLETRLNGGFSTLLRDAGAALANRTAAATTRGGLAAAAAALESFGGPVTITTRRHERVIANGCCPLASVVRRTPQICQLMESLLSSVGGRSMQSRCERGQHPRCVFAMPRER